MEDNYQIEKTFYDVLPIKNNVVFPGVLLPIAVSKKSSLKLIKAAQKENRPLLLLTQKNGKVSKEPQELLAEGQFARLYDYQRNLCIWYRATAYRVRLTIWDIS